LAKSLIYRTALLYLEAAQRASTGSPPCLRWRSALRVRGFAIVTGTALRVRHLAIVTGTAKTASGLTKTATPSPRKARLRDGNRLFGGLVSPRRQVDSPRRHRRASGFRNGRTPRIRRLCVSPNKVIRGNRHYLLKCKLIEQLLYAIA
jgi:hypothetical protein